MAKFIKKNKQEEAFDSTKIYKSIINAMKSGSGLLRPRIAQVIVEECEEKFNKKETIASKDVDKFVINKLNEYGQELTACAYERYKTTKAYQESVSIIDDAIFGVIDGTNTATLDENSNKDGQLISTQRDLIAGIESRSYTERHLMPTHLLNAHNEGLIHIHDTDYMIHRGIFNCQLINLDDMLQNGTVINGKKIRKPKSFQTACTVATQISLQVANGQYGGQTFSVSHLSPFVRVSYEKWKTKVREEANIIGTILSDEDVENIAWLRTRDEVKSGVQTIQFQENTFSSSNGQTPFVSIFMWINEKPEYIKETAMIIEEMINLRYEGMENEYGVKVTPAFPKLLYVLDENNVPKDSEYRWLTDLAVKCAARRMNPDFISAKIMRQQFDGQVFPCMGCVDKDEVVNYRFNDEIYIESIVRMWERLSNYFSVQLQDATDCYYMDLYNVEIFDSTNNAYVECKRMNKNADQGDWKLIKLSDGRHLTCTSDHPLAVKNVGRVLVNDLHVGDEIECTNYVPDFMNRTVEKYSKDMAWLLGVLLCDGCYDRQVSSTFAFNGEDDIIERYERAIKNEMGLTTSVKLWERGEKGNYKEVRAYDGETALKREVSEKLINIFGGLQKKNRQIPNDIMSGTREERLNFLGGMIDADGYIHNSEKHFNTIELGSTNKELAIQTMLLANSLGYDAKILMNHYTSKDLSKIRYRVYFNTNPEIIQYITCKKKLDNYRILNRYNTTKEYFVVEITDLDYRGEYSYDVTTSSDRFDVSGIASHNCRSFLSPWKDENGEYKFYGRFNRGVVTLNLVDIALSAKGDETRFWDIMDERLELCKEALILRDGLIRGAKPTVSPIHWMYGSIARIDKNGSLDHLLDGGYSSISLGYIGIHEMVKVMKGCSNTAPVGEEFALRVMDYLEAKTIEWRNIKGLHGCSLYGTPSESLTYKFAQKTAKRFGEIKGITDKDYFTNSYHVNVLEPIDAFAKLKFESQFQKRSKGGAVSYIEVPNMDNNLEALSEIVDYMYETIQYAEINTRNGDSCGECGFMGEMACDDEGTWYCPQCGCKDKNKLTVVRRTCGYIGSTFWNKGKTEEINDRVMHI